MIYIKVFILATQRPAGTEKWNVEIKIIQIDSDFSSDNSDRTLWKTIFLKGSHG